MGPPVVKLLEWGPKHYDFGFQLMKEVHIYRNREHFNYLKDYWVRFFVDDTQYRNGFGMEVELSS